jgi:hypothetical protein
MSDGFRLTVDNEREYVYKDGAWTWYNDQVNTHFQCDCCYEIITDGRQKGHEVKDGAIVCARCFKDHEKCCDCNELIHADEMIGHAVNLPTRFRRDSVGSKHVKGGFLCHECKMASARNWRRCDLCEDFAPMYHTRYVYDRPLIPLCIRCVSMSHLHCGSCNEYYINRCGCKGDLIKPYSHKPISVFKFMAFTGKNKKNVFLRDIYGQTYGTPVNEKAYNNRGLYFGVELEIDSEDCDVYREAEWLMKRVNSDWIYLKEDGSLTNGFEVVTHPQTFEVWKQKFDEFEPVLRLSKRGFNSHNTSTCGLHISLSRNAFSQSHLYRFSKFVYFNPLFIAKFSRRSLSRLNLWGSPFALSRGNTIDVRDYVREDGNDGEFFLNCLGHALYSTRSLCQNHRNERETALNLPDNRVEFRSPRGTLKRETFIANIEFTQALYEFTSVTNVDGLCPLMFKKFIANNNRFRNLFAWIDERIPSGDMVAHSLMYKNNVLNEHETRQGKELTKLGHYSSLLETVGG